MHLSSADMEHLAEDVLYTDEYNYDELIYNLQRKDRKQLKFKQDRNFPAHKKSKHRKKTTR